MARGWHYTKLSLSSVLILSFSGMCILLVPFFLSILLCFLLCFFALVGACINRCSSDLFLSSRPRTGLATMYITVWLMPDRLM